MHIAQFHPTFREGIVTGEKIYLFAHTNVFIDKDNPFGRSTNFQGMHYESMSSLLLL